MLLPTAPREDLLPHWERLTRHLARPLLGPQGPAHEAMIALFEQLTDPEALEQAFLHPDFFRYRFWAAEWLTRYGAGLTPRMTEQILEIRPSMASALIARADLVPAIQRQILTWAAHSLRKGITTMDRTAASETLELAITVGRWTGEGGLADPAVVRLLHYMRYRASVQFRALRQRAGELLVHLPDVPPDALEALLALLGDDDMMLVTPIVRHPKANPLVWRRAVRMWRLNAAVTHVASRWGARADPECWEHLVGFHEQRTRATLLAILQGAPGSPSGDADVGLAFVDLSRLAPTTAHELLPTVEDRIAPWVTREVVHALTAGSEAHRELARALLPLIPRRPSSRQDAVCDAASSAT